MTQTIYVLCVYPKEIKEKNFLTKKNGCIQIFIEALSVIASNWKQAVESTRF